MIRKHRLIEDDSHIKDTHHHLSLPLEIKKPFQGVRN